MKEPFEETSKAALTDDDLEQVAGGRQAPYKKWICQDDIVRKGREKGWSDEEIIRAVRGSYNQH